MLVNNFKQELIMEESRLETWWFPQKLRMGERIMDLAKVWAVMFVYRLTVDSNIKRD